MNEIGTLDTSACICIQRSLSAGPPDTTGQLGVEAVLAQRAQDVLRAVADALDDGAVHVPGAMAQRQPRQHAARERVRVRRAVALEVVEDDQPVRPDRHLGRPLAEDVVDVDAALLGLRDASPANWRLNQATTDPVDAWPASTVYWPGIIASV